MIDTAKSFCSIKKIENKMEFAMSKINQLTENICLMLLNKPEKKQS